MIKLKLDKETGIAIVAPSAPLAGKDFISLAEKIDPFVNAEVRYFPYQDLDEAITWVKS